MKTALAVLSLLALSGQGCLTKPTPPPTSPPIPVAPSPAPEESGSAQTVAVSIQNFAFSQKTLTVKKGDKVTFTNKDAVAHTSTADAGAWESGILSKDASWTLDTSTLAAGTYAYHCTPHPYMQATLIVQ